ncbi:MAG: transglycosylase domain-containing protein, partial [Solirubrobacteraceae bacterium]
VAEYRAYYGGLKIRTTLDLKLQEAADQAISQELPTGESLPSASLVSIDNKTGQVRAMVGGPIVNGEEDYSQYPFNLATQGRRQPGSSFKPFTLAMALQYGGYGPGSVIDSAPQNFVVPNSGGKEIFPVRNFGNNYSGPITLAEATAISDNTVFAQVGIHVGTKNIARMAKRMGIRTPVSQNYAMILGGLKVGVSPLDMAHAYETLAENGRKVFDPVLGAPNEGPTGIAEISCPQVCPQKTLVDHPQYKRIIPTSVAQTIHELLHGPVSPGGTAPSAAISGVDVAGKTGTTTDYGDAWFVGWTPQLTTAVWVGFPNKLIPMTTDYNGAPVEGGTYPAIIWHNFMVQAL